MKYVQSVTSSGLFPCGHRRSWRRDLVVTKVNEIFFRRLWWLRSLRLLLGPSWAGCSPPTGVLLVFVILLETAAPPAGIPEIVGIATKASTVTVDTSTVSSETFTAEASVSAAGAGEAAAKAHAALDTTELVPVGSGLLSLCTDEIDVAQQLDQLLRAIAHVDTLVLAIVIDIVELAEHPQERDVGPGIINDSFRTVLDQEFKELKGL